MEVTDQLIDKLAHLSRLEFNATEKVAIKKDLQQMISFVEKLNELDLANVEPRIFFSARTKFLREYQVSRSKNPQDSQRNSPHNY
jgi:aspartyl-tRNA(Asn)/glutamyl-tRNA(Gln) amidotransferase subunit C